MTITLGKLTIKNPVFLAPMTGVTDMPFRKMVRRYGAGLVSSEMIASRCMIDDYRRGKKSAAHTIEEGPISAQLAGCEPDVIAEAARIKEGEGASIIDLNFGCPVKKIVNKLGGAALMKDESLAAEIVEKTVKAVSVPVTVKMRLGWDDENKNAPRLAKIAEDLGAKMITVHGRTRCQLYNGEADWKAVQEVVNAVRVPVLVNGDISTPEAAEQALALSGAAGVMIGRGAYGRPWFLKQVMDYLEKKPNFATPTDLEIVEIIQDHYALMIDHYGEYSGVSIARKHLSWYLKQLPDGGIVYTHIKTLENASDVRKTLSIYTENIGGKILEERYAGN